MNKYQEAIIRIKSNYPSSGFTMLREALDLAIEVLEKATPKKVETKLTTVGSIEISHTICPNCKIIIDEWYNGCPNCLQALDWSDDNGIDCGR